MKNKELKDLNQKAKERKHKTHYETSEFFILLTIMRNSVQAKRGFVGLGFFWPWICKNK